MHCEAGSWGAESTGWLKNNNNKNFIKNLCEQSLQGPGEWEGQRDHQKGEKKGGKDSKLKFLLNLLGKMSSFWFHGLL